MRSFPQPSRPGRRRGLRRGQPGGRRPVSGKREGEAPAAQARAEPGERARAVPACVADGAAVLAALPEAERRCAMLLVYGTNGNVALAVAKARELAPRDAVEARLLALLDLLGPAAAKAVVTNGSLGPRLANALVGCAEALDKHRGRGQQTVRVEHVHVHPGAQAVVGVVGDGGRGDGRRIEDRPQTPTARAPEPGAPVPCPGEADRPALPGAGAARPVDVPASRQQGRRARGSTERRMEARRAQRRGAGGTGDAPGAAATGEGGAGDPGAVAAHEVEELR